MGIVFRLVSIVLCSSLIPWNCFAINKKSLIIKRGRLEQIVDKLNTFNALSNKVSFTETLDAIKAVNSELTPSQIYSLKKYLLHGCFSPLRKKLDIDTFFIKKLKTDLNSVGTLNLPSSYSDETTFKKVTLETLCKDLKTMNPDLPPTTLQTIRNYLLLTLFSPELERKTIAKALLRFNFSIPNVEAQEDEPVLERFTLNIPDCFLCTLPTEDAASADSGRKQWNVLRKLLQGSKKISNNPIKRGKHDKRLLMKPDYAHQRTTLSLIMKDIEDEELNNLSQDYLEFIYKILLESNFQGTRIAYIKDLVLSLQKIITSPEYKHIPLLIPKKYLRNFYCNECELKTAAIPTPCCGSLLCKNCFYTSCATNLDTRAVNCPICKKSLFPLNSALASMLLCRLDRSKNFRKKKAEYEILLLDLAQKEHEAEDLLQEELSSDSSSAGDSSDNRIDAAELFEEEPENPSEETLNSEGSANIDARIRKTIQEVIDILQDKKPVKYESQSTDI